MRCLPLLLSTLLVLPLSAAERPNILFFLVDDMGITDTSVEFLHDRAGRPLDVPLTRRYRTPNMERLAAQGRRFDQARAFSVCTPTRAAILTGLHPARLHITTWTHPRTSVDTGAIDEAGLTGPHWRVGGLDPALPTLPMVLAAAGYQPPFPPPPVRPPALSTAFTPKANS